MKCPNCDGSGIVNEPIYNKSHTLIKNWAIVKCKICNGSGEFVEPMTNEEWRKTCSTEEFADFLAGVAHAGAYEVRNCNTNGMLQTQNTDFWLAWLKEKHNG